MEKFQMVEITEADDTWNIKATKMLTSKGVKHISVSFAAGSISFTETENCEDQARRLIAVLSKVLDASLEVQP